MKIVFKREPQYPRTVYHVEVEDVDFTTRLDELPEVVRCLLDALQGNPQYIGSPITHSQILLALALLARALELEADRATALVLAEIFRVSKLTPDDDEIQRML